MQTLSGFRSRTALAAFNLAPGTAYGLQDEPNATFLWWILPAAVVLAGLAYYLGRRLGKRLSEPAAVPPPPPLTSIAPAVTVQPPSALPTRAAPAVTMRSPSTSPSEAMAASATTRVEKQTAEAAAGEGLSGLFGLASAATLERWWVRIPAQLRHYSAVLSTAWVDGMYLTAWPRWAMLLSLFSLAVGFLEGASHWSFLTIDATGAASPPAVVFAQMFPLLVVAVIVGALSANAGLMLVLGYAIGDLVFAGPQLRVPGNVALPQFFYLRVPQLISYFFFFLLAVIPILVTKLLVFSLNRWLRGSGFGPRVALSVGMAAVQAAIIYGWTQAAVMVIRIFWAWAGQYPPLTVPDYVKAADPWLPAAAAAAVLARGWLTYRSRSDKALQPRMEKLLLALQEAEQCPAFSRRLPVWARLLGTALAMTLLVLGFINSLLLGAIVLMAFAAILLARAYALPKLGIWAKWAGVAGKVPLLVRLTLVLVAGYLLTKLVLALPGQAVPSNGVPGKFGAELVSLALGLAVAAALLPQPSDAVARGEMNAPAEPGVRTAHSLRGVQFMLLAIFVLLISSRAYGGICLDPVCCFGSDEVVFWVIVGLLLLLAIMLLWEMFAAAAAVDAVFVLTAEFGDVPAIYVLGHGSEFVAAYAADMGYSVLYVEGWTITLNDLWVSIGIEQGAPFLLTSPLTDEALVGTGEYAETVYAREIAQLLDAGYTAFVNEWGETFLVPPM